MPPRSSRLKIHLLDRADFAKYHDPRQGAGVLFVPTGEPPAAGEQVSVEVVFQGGPHVYLTGQVVWRRATGDARARAGAGVAIDEPDQSRLRYLIGYARGALMDVRRLRRLPVRLKIAYSTPQGRRMNFTRDLHSQGAFIRTSDALPVGSTTELLLSPPPGLGAPISLRGTVVRNSDDPSRGVGVRFEFADHEERERFAAFYKRLEDDYIDGKLPDEVIG